MTKTKEELTVLKEEIKTISKQLYELNDEELAIVSGGYDIDYGLIRQLLEIVFAPLKENK